MSTKPIRNLSTSSRAEVELSNLEPWNHITWRAPLQVIWSNTSPKAVPARTGHQCRDWYFPSKANRVSSAVPVSKKCKNTRCGSCPNLEPHAFETQSDFEHAPESFCRWLPLQTQKHLQYFHVITLFFQLLYALWTPSTTEAVVPFLQLQPVFAHV